jgi:hypothetical protein
MEYTYAKALFLKVGILKTFWRWLLFSIRSEILIWVPLEEILFNDTIE